MKNMKYFAILIGLLIVRCYLADAKTALPMAGILLSALALSTFFTYFYAE